MLIIRLSQLIHRIGEKLVADCGYGRKELNEISSSMDAFGCNGKASILLF